MPEAVAKAVQPWCLQPLAARTGCLLDDSRCSWGLDIHNPLFVILDTALMDVSAEHVARAVAVTGRTGLVLLLISQPETSGLHHLEARLLKNINVEEVLIIKVFMQWRSTPVRIGWAVLLCSHADKGSAASAGPLLGRVMASEVVNHTGALLNLTPVVAAERVSDTHRHMLLAEQRGRAFYTRVVQEIGIATPMMIAGVQPFDYVTCEVDAGVGDLLNIMIDAQENKTPAKGVLWVGSSAAMSKSRSAKDHNTRCTITWCPHQLVKPCRPQCSLHFVGVSTPTLLSLSSTRLSSTYQPTGAPCDG